MVIKHPYGGSKDTVEFYWTSNLGVKYIITNGKITSFSVGKKEELHIWKVAHSNHRLDIKLES